MRKLNRGLKGERENVSGLGSEGDSVTSGCERRAAVATAGYGGDGLTAAELVGPEGV